MKKLIIAITLLFSVLDTKAQPKFYWGITRGTSSTSTLTKFGGSSFDKNISREQGIFLQYNVPVNDDRKRMSFKLGVESFQRFGGIKTEKGTQLKVVNNQFRPALSTFVHWGRRDCDGKLLFDFNMGLGYFMSIPTDQIFEGDVLETKYLGKTDQYQAHGLMSEMGFSFYFIKNIRIDLSMRYSADLWTTVSNKDKAVPVRFDASGITLGIVVPMTKKMATKEGTETKLKKK
jgi:hypothetical protein